MPDDYSGLTVSVRRREDQGLYQFGVYLDGAWVVLAGRKLGGVDDDIAAAKAAAASVTDSQGNPVPDPASDPNATPAQ